jgi:predicted DNA-binding transcriptional regulator AlpA
VSRKKKPSELERRQRQRETPRPAYCALDDTPPDMGAAAVEPPLSASARNSVLRAQPPLPHPFALFRTNRLAQLFGVRRETIFRWRKSGVLPPFTRIGGILGLTGEQVARLLDQRQREAADASR